MNDFFNKIGLDAINRKVKMQPNFRSYLESTYGKINIDSFGDDIVFNKIDDLAQRRNDISHGVDGIQLISVDILSKDYLFFFKIYGISIYDVLYENYLMILCTKLGTKVNIVAIFNSNILCINISNKIVKIGDRVIVKTASNNFFETKIISIEINKRSLLEVNISTPIDVAFKLNKNIKGNQEFYLI